MKKGPKKERTKVLRFSPELELRTYTKGSAPNVMSESCVVKDRRLAAECVKEPKLNPLAQDHQAGYISPLLYGAANFLFNMFSSLSLADEYDTTLIKATWELSVFDVNLSDPEQMNLNQVRSSPKAHM